ncbi:MAG: TetR/AcrR family transcriptional regulator [Anaerolineales bacterium]|nr:TetR/AcrR family transcriptional regulator [Anaerolineales bacterium]
MARTVNKEAFARKRSEILDTAQRLIFSKGYQRMTIQDICGALSMSSGAFFHYFASKPAVLAALIERIQEGVEAPLRALVEDPALSALDKLRRFFTTLDQARVGQQAFIAELVQVWFADDNALLRDKVDEALVKRRAPLLTVIIRQGIQEKVFVTPYPAQAAEIILAMARGMSTALTRYMLAAQDDVTRTAAITAVVDTFAAYADAIERVLGASAPFLDRLNPAAVHTWLSAPTAPNT